MVLEEIDRMLADHQLEIVILETGDDSYVWTIENKEQS